MVEIGLQIEPQFGFTYSRIRDLAALCESVGFNSLWCSDHFFLDGQSEERDCWDVWTVLTGLAVETSTLRLGSLVTCVSYRPPPVLAKMAACVDVMSGGRLDFGVGAGWKQMEYEAYGIPFPTPSERVDRFEEALEVIRLLWTEPSASYGGQYYRIRDAASAPKPVQTPYPPIWVGGSKRRVMGIAAKYADGVNIGGFPSVDAYSAGLDRLREACLKHGRDYDSIRKSQFTGVLIAEDGAALDGLVQDVAEARGQTAQELRQGYRGFIGTPEEVAESLRPFVDLGVEQFMLVFPYGHETESVKLIAERVMPAFSSS